ncbi:MAG: M13 family metallopeptidase [Candidatus Eremiobacteraeota bacterium]|nr:M13 family metallopeptidase [Candidatus Eremiobacteraeota bacterium]
MVLGSNVGGSPLRLPRKDATRSGRRAGFAAVDVDSPRMRPPSLFTRAALSIAFFATFALPTGAAAPTALPPSNFDRSVASSADFYRFAVGGWLAKNTIPLDRTSWGTFDELEQRNERRVRAILESHTQTAAQPGSERRKIGDFYASCIDVARIARAGISGLRPQLARIDALTSRAQLAGLIESGDALDGAAPENVPALAFGSEQDPKEATRVIAGIAQGGLSLPTRDYYLANDARSKAIRAAFLTYLNRVFSLLGDDTVQARTESNAVMSLETTLARASKTPDALRDPFANYHPMTLAGVERLAPHFEWRTYFTQAGLDSQGTARIDVGQPAFFTALDGLAAAAPLAQWKSYLRWHAAAGGAAALPKPYRDANFAFAHELYGIARQPARTRTCVQMTDAGLGFAVGKVYVAQYFSPAARARARAEIALIKASLHNDIEHVPWMGPQTRAAALAKLAKLSTVKVGYPDHWRNYSALPVSRANFLADVLAAQHFEFKRDVAKIGKPLNRYEWGLTPQTVNAYYDPSMNEVVIPAGILETPFFDEHADDAVNFGGIGAVIGHEMTHGFDDEGSDYDGNGNLHRIVTPADTARFHARVACVINQLDAYKSSVGLNLNGKLDAGEATADIGGTTLAYRALETSLSGKPRPQPIGGFTPQQRYFLSWAQVWREKQRPQAERAQILGDPHPPSPYRVNGTLSDEANFVRAFHITPGSAMWKAPDKRCQIW